MTTDLSPVAEASSTAPATWFPLFEFQEYAYESFLLLPDASGAEPAARRWARGDFVCGQAFTGYALPGVLRFADGLELQVKASGQHGVGDEPASFEATGIGVDGPLRGVRYELTGWVLPELPIRNGAARVLGVRGAIRAVRGTDAKPGEDPSGNPLGTVGLFAITRTGLAT